MSYKLYDQVRNYSVVTDNSGQVLLSGLVKRFLILFFYPKDLTPGCTQESCEFRDLASEFMDLDAQIVGISKDDVASHNKFRQQHALNFPLISDDGTLCEDFGLWVEKSMYGKKYKGIQRATYILDEHLKVIAAWPQVKVEGHVDQVLTWLQNFEEK